VKTYPIIQTSLSNQIFTPAKTRNHFSLMLGKIFVEHKKIVWNKEHGLLLFSTFTSISNLHSFLLSLNL